MLTEALEIDSLKYTTITNATFLTILGDKILNKKNVIVLLFFMLKWKSVFHFRNFSRSVPIFKTYFIGTRNLFIYFFFFFFFFFFFLLQCGKVFKVTNHINDAYILHNSLTFILQATIVY